MSQQPDHDHLAHTGPKYRHAVVVEIGAENYTCQATTGEHVFFSDEPISAGGQNKGPSPTKMLLASIGSCVAITLRMYAERKGWDLQRVQVGLNVLQEGTERRIVRQLRLVGDLDGKQRKRLSVIAGRCPVSRMVAEGTPIDGELVDSFHDVV